MPSGLIKEDNGVRSEGDFGCDLVEMELHGAGSTSLESQPLSGLVLWDPQHWLEARTVAGQMTHEEARTIMRRIAMDYDRLAKLAEVQLIQQATERKT